MAKLTFTLHHQLDQADARRRLERERERLSGMLDGKSGRGESHWQGDRLLFDIHALGQSANGVLTIEQPGVVAVEATVPLPALLLRGKVEKRLRKVLRID